jgi:YD repeat-containing protein
VEGLVRGKQYQGQTFTNIVYGYDVDGRLTARTFWLDGSTHHETDYGYDDAGNLLTINYPNSPDVSFTYNEVNRIKTMATVGLGTTTFTYDDAENLASEYGLWSYDTVTYSYDSNVPHLRTGLTVSQPAGSWSQTYHYDAADRLHTTTAPAGTFTYTYSAGATLWTNLALPTYYASAVTNGYDSGGRLLRTAMRSNTGSTLDSETYSYNTYGQAQRKTLTDASYTTYGYDDDSQLTSSLGYDSGGSPIAAQQLGYTYDAGWNVRPVRWRHGCFTNSATLGPARYRWRVF